VPFLWLSERKAGTDLLQAKTKIGQFGQAPWWSISALIGQAQDMPSRLVVSAHSGKVVWRCRAIACRDCLRAHFERGSM
jgi:hypothetical protein